MTERDYGRRFFTAWAIVFGAATIILNAVESGRLNSGWGNVVGASATGALPPIILLVTTHAATLVVRHSRRASRVTLGFGIALGGGALASGAMAFGGSFTALTALATHWHWSTPVFLPLSLDIALLTMSLGSVWTALMVARDAESTMDSVDSDLSESIVSTVDAEPESTPESIGRDRLYAPSSAGPVSTVCSGGHAPVESTVDSSGDLRESTVFYAASMLDAVGVHGAESTGHDGLGAPESTPAESTESAVDVGESTVDSTPPASTESIVDVAAESTPTPTAERPSLRVVTAPAGSLAERVAESLAGDVDADTVAAALRLRGEEMSLRRIADELGIGSHSTVRKWVKTAEEIQAEVVTA